jgi:hypothetical protein
MCELVGPGVESRLRRQLEWLLWVFLALLELLSLISFSLFVEVSCAADRELVKCLRFHNINNARLFGMAARAAGEAADALLALLDEFPAYHNQPSTGTRRDVFGPLDVERIIAGDIPALGAVLYNCGRRESPDDDLATALLDVARARGALREVLVWNNPGWGGTALDNAAQHGVAATVSALLEAGAVPDTPNRINPELTGYALSAATSNGHGKVVEMLLLGGADPYRTGCMGEEHSSLQAAMRRNNDDLSVFRAFLRAGVDLTVEQEDGTIPLEVAQKDKKLQPLLKEFLGSRTKSAAKR